MHVTKGHTDVFSFKFLVYSLKHASFKFFTIELATTASQSGSSLIQVSEVLLFTEGFYLISMINDKINDIISSED